MGTFLLIVLFIIALPGLIAMSLFGVINAYRGFTSDIWGKCMLAVFVIGGLVAIFS